MSDETQPTPLCPHCGRPVLSPRALSELAYARKHAPARGGYLWEGARLAYERGDYKDATLSELLLVGALAPHGDPAKGYVVRW